VHNWNKGKCLGKVDMYIVVVGIHKGLDNNVVRFISLGRNICCICSSMVWVTMGIGVSTHL